MKNISKKLHNAIFQDSIEELIEWVNKKGFSVQFDYCIQDEMRPADKLITVSTRQSKENQFYSFLHECGHLVLSKNEKSYRKKYPSSAKLWDKNNYSLQNSHKYKVDTVAEEIDAWRKGLEIAKRLNLYVDEEKYYNLTAKFVWTYIEYYGKLASA